MAVPESEAEDKPLERAVLSYPPAFSAADVLRDRAFAEAMGFGWLHEEDTEFVRLFRSQVQQLADAYARWLESGEDTEMPTG